MSDPKKMGESKRFTPGMFVLFSAATLLFSVGPAAAQSAPAGPLPAAQASDQALPAPPARSTAPIAGKPNLAGTWKLNSDESDDPMQKMREARQDSQGGGGRRGRWGGMRGGRGRGQGPGGMMNELSQLTVEESPSMTKITGSSGRVLALYSAPVDQGTTNASSQPESTKPSSSDAAVNTSPTAQWQGSQLVVTQQMGNGTTTTRTYEMSPDNKQLYVTTKIVTMRLNEPVTFRLVYDSVQAKLPGGE